MTERFLISLTKYLWWVIDGEKDNGQYTLSCGWPFNLKLNKCKNTEWRETSFKLHISITHSWFCKQSGFRKATSYIKREFWRVQTERKDDRRSYTHLIFIFIRDRKIFLKMYIALIAGLNSNKSSFFVSFFMSFLRKGVICFTYFAYNRLIAYVYLDMRQGFE